MGLLLAVLLAGLALRLLRLEWQPLWWDEGYSAYFATEPLGRMLWLTSRDIHPPLYYGLLHGWILALAPQGKPLGAAVLRTFSVLTGFLALPAMVWLAATFFPSRRRIPLLAALLLAVNPMHLYYSQEIRMYGLAMVLGMVSTGCLWHGLQSARHGRPDWRPLLGYVMSSTLALYTLYYMGLLVVAQLAWTCWYLRERPRRWRPWLLAGLAVGLLYLPWLLYAVPNLLGYVQDKVQADQDRPLDLFSYTMRHLRAFLAGHVSAPDGLRNLLMTAGGVGLIPLVMATRDNGAPPQRPPAEADARQALWTFLLAPAGLAFLLNLRLPFFPQGGERLLLFALPYFLLLLAHGLDRGSERSRLAAVALACLLVGAGAGVWTFLSVPRYSEEDYRPIVAQITQQARPQDTVLAIFPWQVGYWRVYGPRQADGSPVPPQPAPLGQEALRWGPAMATAIDRALAPGTVWFPAPLAFGSTLPGEIEAYLQQHATNVVNRWFSTTTRLSAWAQVPTPGAQDHQATLGPVTLLAAGFAPEEVASANQPVAVALRWRWRATGTYHVTLRLQDSQGRVWAGRDYEPLGLFASPGPAGPADQVTEQVGFLIPAGLPPGPYTLAVGVGDGDGSRLFPVDDAPGALQDLVPLGEIQVVLPTSPPAPVRLPIQFPLETPATLQGVAVLGGATLPPGQPALAGDELPVRLFLRFGASAADSLQINLRLLDRGGYPVAGWSGWPLVHHPPGSWPPGALAQLPISFFLPADLEPGRYRLAVALEDQATGQATPPSILTAIEVTRRPAQFAAPSPSHRLDPPVQFGTHVRLVGYGFSPQGNALALTLYWEVLQPLLPPHHIFVHVDTAAGKTIAQADGPPETSAGPAPSGSWLPGEYLATTHLLPISDGQGADGPAQIRVGLYRPGDNVRLPASRGGKPVGDAAVLVWPRP